MRSGVIPWILAAFLAFGATAAQAQRGPSLDRILPQIRSHHPGKFYDAEGPFRGPDGQARYRLKWMTPSGRIVWFDADARTGRVLGPDAEMRNGPFFREGPHYFDPRYGGPRAYPPDERRWNRGAPWPRQDYPRRRPR
jgi:hypothetical protein